MRFALLVALTGCTGVARPGPQPDAAEPPPMATAQFAPQLCTSGAAGDTSGCATGGACCPFNAVDLTTFGIVGELEFIVQALSASDLYLDNLQLQAGADGLYVENLRIVGEPCTTPASGATFDLAPNTTMALPTTEALVGTRFTEICVVVDAIGPYRP